MSYRDPYADPYYDNANRYQANYQANYAGPNYSHNQYAEDNNVVNPYTQPSRPTYDQNTHGDVYGESGYTDEPAYPPQRQPTHRTQHSGSGALHQRNESYQPQGDFTSTLPPGKKTVSKLREYRYQHQGALWTRGSRGRCIGRFCCCTLMTVVFLIVSIVLALALWVRPPGIIIGDVGPVSQDGSQITTQASGDGVTLTIHLAANITVNNPNYFSVNFKQIKAELFYPINNTPIGGGGSQNVVFRSHTSTDWTFPFDVQYKSAADPGSLILADLTRRCVTNRANLNVGYKITLGLRILFLTISPVIDNTFSFPCPLDRSTLEQIAGGNLDLGN